jgi:sigma-B regulation protein RsbU (phosphoserine phosphatase)
VYVVSSVFVWILAPPTPQTLGHLLRTGWKFPVLITFVSSVLIFLYQTTKQKLEQRNTELQRSVDLGTAQLEMQEQELQRAREIQQSLLPKEIPQLPGFEVAGIWRPARAVSGDYYDVFKLGRNKLGVCVADVAGKGVSAALLMANVQAAVHAFASESESAAWLCGKVNALLYEKYCRRKVRHLLLRGARWQCADPAILQRRESLSGARLWWPAPDARRERRCSGCLSFMDL